MSILGLANELSSEDFINKMNKKKALISIVGFVLILLDIPIYFLSKDIYYVVSPVLSLLCGLCYMTPLFYLYVYQDGDHVSDIKTVIQQSSIIITFGALIVLMGFFDVFRSWVSILT